MIDEFLPFLVDLLAHALILQSHYPI